MRCRGFLEPPRTIKLAERQDYAHSIRLRRLGPLEINQLRQTGESIGPSVTLPSPADFKIAIGDCVQILRKEMRADAFCHLVLEK